MVETIKIKDMRMLVTPHPTFVKKEASADEIAKTLIANPRLKSVYVVDDKLKLIGKITLRMLIKHEFMDLLPRYISYFNTLDFVGEKTAENIMIGPIYVTDNDTLKTAFVTIYEYDLDELPVVNEKLKLIGNIDMLELLTMLIEKKEQKAGKKILSLTSNQPFYRQFK